MTEQEKRDFINRQLNDLRVVGQLMPQTNGTTAPAEQLDEMVAFMLHQSGPDGVARFVVRFGDPIAEDARYCWPGPGSYAEAAAAADQLDGSLEG